MQQQSSNKRRKIALHQSILDLPDDVIVNILYCLRPKRNFIGLRALRELQTIVNIAQSCTRMLSLVSIAYGTEFQSLYLTYPSVRFYQYVFHLQEKWYSTLINVPFLCNKVLREVRLTKLQSTAMLERFFNSAVKHCSNLQHLTFHDDNNLSISAFAKLSKLESLRELAIVQPSTLALATLTRSLPRLHSLFLLAIRTDYLFLVSDILKNRTLHMGKWKNYKSIDLLLLVLSFSRPQLIGDSLRRFARTIVNTQNQQTNTLKLLGVSNLGRKGNLGPFVRIMTDQILKIPPNLIVEVSEHHQDSSHREDHRFHSYTRGNLVHSDHAIFESVHIFPEVDHVTSSANEIMLSIKNATTILVLNNSSVLHNFVQSIKHSPSIKKELEQVSINRVVWKITHYINVNETAKNISTLLVCLKKFKHIELCFESCFHAPLSYMQDLSRCCISNQYLESILVISNIPFGQFKFIVDELLLLIPVLNENLKSVFVQPLDSNHAMGGEWVEDVLSTIKKLESQFPNLDLDSFKHLDPKLLS